MCHWISQVNLYLAGALDRLFAAHPSLDRAAQAWLTSSSNGDAVARTLASTVRATFALEGSWAPLAQQLGRGTLVSVGRALRLLHAHHLLPADATVLAAHLSASVLPRLGRVAEPVPPGVALEASVALSLALALGWPVLPAGDPAGSDPAGSLLAAILDPRPVLGAGSAGAGGAAAGSSSGSLVSRGAMLHQRLRGDVHVHLLKPHELPAVVAHLLAHCQAPRGWAVFEELAAHVLASPGGGLASGGGVVGPRAFLEAAAPHLASLAPPPGASVAALRTRLGCCEQVGAWHAHVDTSASWRRGA